MSLKLCVRNKIVMTFIHNLTRVIINTVGIYRNYGIPLQIYIFCLSVFVYHKLKFESTHTFPISRFDLINVEWVDDNLATLLVESLSMGPTPSILKS